MVARHITSPPEPYQWQIHGTNCFTVPKSIATGAFDPGFPDRFDAQLQLLNHYDLSGTPENPEHILPQPFDLHRLEVMVCEALGLELAQRLAGNELVPRLCEQLSAGALALVPIDKYASWAWPGHRREHHASLLLVTAYDANVDRFETFDGEHNAALLDTPLPWAPSERSWILGHRGPLLDVPHASPTLRTVLGEACSRHYVTPELLVAGNRAYDEHYGYLRGSFQTLAATDATEASRRRSPAEVVRDLADLVEPHVTEVPRLIAAKVAALAKEPGMTDRQRNRYINSQQILATALARLVGRAYGDDAAHAVHAAGLRACQQWQHWALALAVDRRRPTAPTSEHALQQELVAAEQAFLDALCRATCVGRASPPSFVTTLSSVGRRASTQPLPGAWMPRPEREVVELHKGFPFDQALPTTELLAGFHAAMQLEGTRPLHYYGSSLVAELRERLHACSVAKGVPGTTIVTSGIVHGLELALRALVDPNDTVALEAPTYMETLEIVRNFTDRVVCYPVDEHGLVVDALADDLRRGRVIKVLVINPSHHNPSGRTLCTERRLQLAALAEEHELVILEDDAYGELHFEASLEPVACTSRRTLYFGSLSKTIAPGIRVGWVTGPEALVGPMSRLIKDHGHPLVRAAVAMYLRNVDHAGRVAWLREHYAARAAQICDLLAAHLPPVVQWSRPTGGFFVWLRVPGVDCGQLLHEALANGVSFVPGEHFFRTPTDGREYLRLSYCTADTTAMELGVVRLSESIHRAMSRPPTMRDDAPRHRSK